MAAQHSVGGFVPSQNGLHFPNRFPGVPLPGPLAQVIDTSKSVHGLCGGMCFTVIDHFKAGRPVPLVDAVPDGATPLYEYLSKRQWESWGLLGTEVLRYVQWMTYSDKKAGAESFESWELLKGRLDADELTVIGLVYNDIRETLRVWDNHQVLAHGYTVQDNGAIHIHVYDPNYPNLDTVRIEATPVRFRRWFTLRTGLISAQYVGQKKVHDIHGWMVVPYDYSPPPDDLGFG